MNFIKNICKSLGENNKPTYVVMAIALVKGICRPAFTMMDKTEKPETKKYTALREGLTEVIAMPAYWACGELAAKFGKSIASKDMDKKFEKAVAKGRNYTEEVKLEMKTEAIKKGQKGLMFIGVCTAALFVIPGLCSLIIKPVMDKMGIKSPQKEDKKLDIKEQTEEIKITNNIQPATTIKRPQMSSFYNAQPVGMKVGGV